MTSVVGSAVEAVEPAEVTQAGPARDRRGRAVTLLWQVLLFLAFLGLWQVAHWLKLVRPIVLRSPGEVWQAAVDLVSAGQLWPNLWATLQATLIALTLGAVTGVLIGLGLALSPRVERIVDPYLSALNSAPRIAFAPVFIVAFGITTTAKVALAFSVVVFVVILNSRAGVHAADPDVIRLMEVMGARKSQIFRKLLFPVAVPSIFAGLRLGLIYSLLGVVTSEMIAAKDGLGQLVATFSGNFELDRVYAVIAVLIIAATLLNSIAGLIERRLLWWKPR
ncbi:ABC transporter permease [Acrocarpospora catenulata]|uniref:ABC transporter permease n=1 Tax=Acrocarpospora catenulata TaxID=2836182 RepID=UPI001BD9ECD3|nr:ABC transporter permease [Acrocarpospora catenulata]